MTFTQPISAEAASAVRLSSTPPAAAAGGSSLAGPNARSSREQAKHAIDNLRSIAELCRSGRALPEALASWLAASLQIFLDGRYSSFAEAFGLKNSRGGISWRSAASIRARNAALRDLASRHFGHLSMSNQAKLIHRDSSRYAATAWRFDRQRQSMPAEYVGTSKEFLWRAFKSGAAMPLCLRQLRTILAGVRSSSAVERACKWFRSAA